MKNTAELPENTEINKYAIELKESKQQPFRLIYNLGLIELEMLKIYIKIKLANGFIRLSIFPTGAFILFDKKPDRSLYLCIDYWDFNNITIKN